MTSLRRMWIAVLGMSDDGRVSCTMKVDLVEHVGTIWGCME